MAEFDYPNFVNSLKGARNGSVTVRLAPGLAAMGDAAINKLQWKAPRPRLDLAPIRAFCRATAKQVKHVVFSH